MINLSGEELRVKIAEAQLRLVKWLQGRLKQGKNIELELCAIEIALESTTKRNNGDLLK